MRADRKMHKAERSARRASKELAKIESRTMQRLSRYEELKVGYMNGRDPGHAAPVDLRRRALRRFVFGFVGVLVLAGLAGGGYYAATEYRDRKDEERVATAELAQVSRLGEALVLHGDWTSSELAAATDLGDSVTVDGSTVLLRRPVVIGDDAKLQIIGSELRLLSDATASVVVEVRGGELELDRARVVSWDEEANGVDENPDDGRASVVITDGGQADVNESEIVSLGYDRIDNHGFTFTGGGTSGTVTGTQITDASVGLTVSGPVDVSIRNVTVDGAKTAGIELAGTSGVEVKDSVVRAGLADGILVRGSSSDIELKNNDVYDNVASGIALVGSGEVKIEDNLVHRNGRAGLILSDTRGASITSNQVWGNTTGISLVAGNTATVITDNRIGGNRTAGVESASAGNSVEIRDNVIDHNDNGVLVIDGTIELVGNQVEGNAFGISVTDLTPQTKVKNNSVTSSAEGAIRMVKAEGLEISGNQLSDNRMAPFIVEHANDSLAFHEDNDAEGGREGVEWVYEQLRSASEFADITPVPSEFFTQPNVEFLLPKEQTRR